MNHFSEVPKVKTTNQSLNNDKCIIEGEEYPLVIGQIIKLIEKGDQPRIVVLADPGHGKTYLLGRLSEILHDELDILNGSFDPQNQMMQNPTKFVNRTRTQRRKIFTVPDADAVFPSDKWHTPENQANRKVIYLTRRTGNLLAYDAHELSKCDKAIRTNHNIRLVSVGSADNYKFSAEYITRKNDSLTEDIISKNKGLWTVDKPSSETVKRIEQMDNSEKTKQLEEAEEKIEMQHQDNSAAQYL